ncbi:MAG: hypothetical protein IKG82_03995 [Oscillospiraceae bacterium]|nr:hypothetical protein [Oscillospiraceae bacterium]
MNRQQIKLLAITAMTLDHIALVFVPSGSILYYVMRLIGRLTAPLMVFMLTEGYRYTRSRSRYLLRLVIFALISQPFYFRLAFGRAPESIMEYCTHWNVMLSLAIGLLIIMLFDSSIHSCTSIVLLGCLISLAHFCDWSYLIPAWSIIFFCDYARENKAMALHFVLASVVLQTLIWLPQYESFAQFSYQYGTLLALIPISMYNGELGNVRHKSMNRWFFYVYYPAHMAVLLVIQACVNMLLLS